jgi:YbbR domain-containing protein
MLPGPFRWLLSNLGTMLLALALAMIVWIASVTAADPDVEFTRTVSIEVLGLEQDFVLISERPSAARVTLRAPQSVRDRMIVAENSVNTWIDLTGLQEGTHMVEVRASTSEIFRPARLIGVNPEFVTVNLDRRISRTFQVRLVVTGEPAIGYQRGVATRDPSSVSVVGPESLVMQVDEVRARLDISDARETINIDLPLEALDANGNRVSDDTDMSEIKLEIIPNEVSVTQPISLLGGYRNVVVRALTLGDPASGYTLRNITVSPPNVLVFSADPQLVMDLPGFVETVPLDISGLEDDIDTLLTLDLPEGISVVGDRTVLVEVSISPILGNIRITLPVIPIGLLPFQTAEISPERVELIISGPVPLLNMLESSDIEVVVDLRNFDLGTYIVDPEVNLLPEDLQVDSILPESVEVNVIRAPTPTPASAP